jgi:hypothetical protein
MTYEQTNQLWISLRVGTDILPLLTNLCSKECESKLPKPPKDYVQFAHKGGADLEQPLDEDELFEIEMKKNEEEQSTNVIETKEADNKEAPSDKPTEKKEFTMLKLIRKIWER